MRAPTIPRSDKLSLALLLRLARLRRFFRSPKGYALVALVALAAVATPAAGLDAAATVIVAAIAGASIMEVVLIRLGQAEWRFPSSAILSGLIVGLVLSPQEPWYVAAAAGFLATDAKHLLRLGRSHIFNPAAAGLMAVYLLFSTGQSWWGALPDLPAPALVLLLIAGYLVAERANKLPAALTFGAVYVVLFTAASFFLEPAYVSEVFRSPFVNATLFFALFMVTDPPTSPVTFIDQFWFGAVVAAASYLTYILTRGLYFLLIGILAGNAIYALVREIRRRVARPEPTRPADPGRRIGSLVRSTAAAAQRGYQKLDEEQ